MAAMTPVSPKPGVDVLASVGPPDDSGDEPSLLRTALRGGAFLAMALGVFAVAALLTHRAVTSGEDAGAGRPTVAVAVEAAPVDRRTIRELRTLAGTLQAQARSQIAARISGQLESIHVNIGDRVASGDVIATLDGAELHQAVEEARADLMVAEANLAESRSMLEIAKRSFERVKRLFEQEIASESELDAARADHEARSVRVRVSESQVSRAEAKLRAAEVRLSYATISASWADPNGPRIIGQRFVDEGSTVAANAPIVSLLDIDALIAVVYVSERDYTRLRIGQPVQVTSDAHPGQGFEGAIVRLAPEFREASRQARVEVELPNPGHRLKPGMFIRAEVELDRADDAVVVPRDALLRRHDVHGVFLIDAEEKTVRFVPVELGIHGRGGVQVLDPVLEGRVVTLGQHMLDDGSAVRIAGGLE